MTSKEKLLMMIEGMDAEEIELVLSIVQEIYQAKKDDPEPVLDFEDTGQDQVIWASAVWQVEPLKVEETTERE